jgi:5-(carboxyamino)imidazole ribonucleotide synthase
LTALKPGSVIGILGGGQLGRMLAMAAARFSYRVVIFDPDANAPAAQVANEHIIAAYEDEAALKAFARKCDVVTYEFENVPVAAAKRIAEITPVFPKPNALEAAQDRVVEKTFLNSIGVETAPFRAVESLQDLIEALTAYGGSGVLKTRRFGYDGKGQAVLQNASADQAAKAFAELGGAGLILEALVPFDAEISVIAARGMDGRIACFDPARNVHRGGILATSTVPSGFSAKTESAAKSAASAILEELDYVGVIGVEFFVLADGRLLVNEIAPRVHNSGHWTEAACGISQFEQHIRAITGLPLGDPARHSDCVMENLIGFDVERAEALAAEPGVYLHLYGKAEPREGRKMGHFTRMLRKP